jgi:hypothetical protein
MLFNFNPQSSRWRIGGVWQDLRPQIIFFSRLASAYTAEEDGRLASVGKGHCMHLI